MGQIVDAVKAFLEKKDWTYSEGESLLRGVAHGRAGRWDWWIFISDDDRFFTVNSVIPVNVPEVRRAAAADYVARSNRQLRVGCFEIDPADGEVLFKIGVPVDSEVSVTQKLVEEVMLGNFYMTEDFLPGLLAVAFGKVSPKTASQRNQKRAPAKPRKSRRSQIRPGGRLLEGLN